jgi:hypothetical protein
MAQLGGGVMRLRIKILFEGKILKTLNSSKIFD